MSEEEKSKYRNVLDPLFNSSNDSDAGPTNVFQQLANLAEQRVDQIDYQQQIDRWNRYQDLLDKIDKRCTRRAGVRLARNVKHNFRVFTDVSSAGLSMIGIIAVIALSAGISMNYDIYYLAGGLVTLGFVGWQALIRLQHPSIIHFKCGPVLHIDEFTYIRQTIKGIPPAEHDPIVKLPTLEMSIPRAWLAQQGMLSFMESLGDIERKEDNAGDAK